MVDSVLVTIVVPVYNVEDYLSRCIQTLEWQEYDNIEIIFIDDGSTDTSKKIIEQYMEKSKRKIQLISIPNSGVSVARNKGIQAANGKYICFVDADDMLDKYYIQYMVTALRKNENCKIVICQKRTISDECIDISDNIEKLDYTIEKHSTVLGMMLYHTLTVGIWCSLVETNYLKENNLYFEEGFKYSEDLQLLWKMIVRSDKVILLNNKLYCYRKRRNSAMNRFNPNRKDGYILFQKLEEYIKKYNEEFYAEFKKFGLSYWVWSTLWQAANLSPDYKTFKKNISFIDARYHLKKMIKYPNFKVKISSMLYLITPYGYFRVLKFYCNKNELNQKNKE